MNFWLTSHEHGMKKWKCLISLHWKIKTISYVQWFFPLKISKSIFLWSSNISWILFQYYLISHKIEKRKHKLVRILAVNWFCFIQVSQSWRTSNLIFSHLKQNCTPGPVINNSRFWHFLHVICKKFVSCSPSHKRYTCREGMIAV